MNCNGCNSEVSEGARFCSACGRVVAAGPVVASRLSRPRAGRAIGGVCAGFAQAYGWDVILVRLALVAAVIFGCGAPILFYIGAWIVMPNEPFVYTAPTGTQPNATAAA